MTTMNSPTSIRDEKNPANYVKPSHTNLESDDSQSLKPDSGPNQPELYQEQEKPAMLAVKGVKSPGVARMEVLSSVANWFERGILYFGIFLLSYAYGLGGTIIGNATTYGLSALDVAAMQSAVNVVSTIASAAAYPVGAKLSDVFGRLNLLILGLVFYIVGMICSASAHNYATLAGGSVLYRIGVTVIQIILEALVGDFTTIRARVFFSYLPALPFILNAWIGGNVSNAIFGNNTKIFMWRWGFGMWTIIITVMALLLVITLAWLHLKASRKGLLKNHPTIWSQRTSTWKFIMELFWLLDVIGVILIIGVFILILYPLTIAGGFNEQWKTAKVIAPIVIGFVLIFPWILYELWAPHPLVPFRKMGHRYILGPLAIALLLDFIWEMEGDYLFTMLQVCFGFSNLAATRIASMYSFCSVISGALCGVVIYFVRRIKIFILAGTCIFMIAFALLIRYRGGMSDRAGVIAAECVLGVGGGLFSYPTQAVIQAFVPHEHMAVMTGLYLSLYSIGMSIGAAVSGAVYTNLLPKQLRQNMPANNATLVIAAYGTPATFIMEYPMGTPIREAMIDSYKYIQCIMCVIGICLCVLLIIAAIILPNPILTDERSLVEEDVDTAKPDKGDTYHTPSFWVKTEQVLSLPPKKRVRPVNQSKYERILNELW